ncbi:MAG: 2-C-methyl-D-erythritol 2,4-cyclodiphosphate synthase [Geodermatophilaceae bacterium]
MTVLAGRLVRSSVNVDATLIAEAPKIAPHIAAMREKIARALQLEPHADQHQGDDERRPRHHWTRRRNGSDGGGERGAGLT